MAVDNPQEPQATPTMPEGLAHSGTTGHEKPVHEDEFSGADLVDVVDLNLVNTEGPTTTGDLPDFVQAPEKKSRRKFLIALGAGVAVVALAVYGALKIGGDSDSSGQNNSNQTSGQDAGNKPPSSVHISPETGLPTDLDKNLPPELDIPSGFTAQLLANQLFSNYTNAINRNDVRFLAYEVADLNSKAGQEGLAAMKKFADFRKLHPDYTDTFTPTVIQDQIFTGNESERVITFRLAEDEHGTGVESDHYSFVKQMRLIPVERTVDLDDGDGPHEITLWLIDTVQDVQN